MTHFKLNHFFTNKQFGFIKGRSATLQLLQVLDNWTELSETGGQIECILFVRLAVSNTLQVVGSYLIEFLDNGENLSV